MGSKTDAVKGRVKEAVGALTDNEKLRDEGKADQAAGKVKDTTEKVIRGIKKAAQKAIDKVKGAAARGR
jgi:uncharacterized protein YjbJ (UPF0337 family)